MSLIVARRESLTFHHEIHVRGSAAMFVKEILQTKGSEVFGIDVRSTLADVVNELVTRNCGSLVVLDRDRLVGIITERDILHACQRWEAGLHEIPVRDVMTKNVVTVGGEEKVDRVMGWMTEHRLRHLPVLDETGELAGLVSIGDVVKATQHELAQENHFLKAYLTS